MRFPAAICTILMFASYAAGSTIERRKPLIDYTECPGGKKAVAQLETEFEFARKMISVGGEDFGPENEFAKAFFDPKRLTESKIKTMKDRFRTMRRMADPGKKEKYLETRRIILCPLFWEMETTESLIKRCETEDISLRDVRRTQARVLVHELAHSVSDLISLAKGEHVYDRKIQPSKKAEENAESYAMTLVGTYYDRKCKILRPNAKVLWGTPAEQAQETEHEVEPVLENEPEPSPQPGPASEN
ncbi:hypothetical protein BU24DRAFT_450963 [Aaosphaeria arxii CBS 175.79]|uniref:Lysine-specific metallo-endopeptidase domain-containing protein n=1 Tax=Aaosphaeria arxii CBS 175.79 TaxID=1450172 RepID=A0A6A5XUG0_9PLEO|nr:uncharacterized protein BU24DRAFT_450963 [Aaosphaeria arxii CBS 175.79]KAF2016447.1 hypothetical protein BU24DRAFT_450963 [Aaosphaeria arxii CBS 175.79]